MKQIAHQHFCLQHILNAAKARNQDPRILAEWFFAKVNPPKLRAAFEEELDDFKALVRRIAFTEMNKIAEAEVRTFHYLWFNQNFHLSLHEFLNFVEYLQRSTTLKGLAKSAPLLEFQ